MSVSVFVPADSSALSVGANLVADAILAEARRRGLEIAIVRTGSRGLFWLEPLVEVETAAGRVTFPVVYEGPPGLVNGGFLAVFFDCITQHQSCAARRTGKTRSLTVTFRRPTPILTELRFDIARTEDEDEGRVTSTARLLLGEKVLCIGEFKTVASSPDKLTGFQFGKRRVKN